MTAEQNALPMFYSNPVPVDTRKHEGVGVAKDIDLSFTREATALPVTILELAKAMGDYPLAFLKAADGVVPVAITGFREKENLFVDENGRWTADTYVPAYVRRYPFILAAAEGAEKLTLCVDEKDGNLVEGAEEPLVKDGKGTDTLNKILDFCRSYDQSSRATREFGEAVNAAGLLRERHAEIKMQDGSIHRVGGFMMIDEDKLRELSGEKLEEWHKKGWLGALYAILLSGDNWRRVMSKAAERGVLKAA